MIDRLGKIPSRKKKSGVFMESKKRKPRKNQIFITSLLLTIAVFSIGIILSYSLDYFRINEINSVIHEYELEKEAYLIEQSFMTILGNNTCYIMEKKIVSLKEEIKTVGSDLSKYSKNSIFRKTDINLLKREYHTLQLKFLSIINSLNERCGKRYIPILFFFDPEDELANERQAFVLDDINKEFQNSVVIITLDAFYTEEPLVTVLRKRFNATSAPFIVIDNTIKFNRIVYTGEIRAILNNISAEMDKKDTNISERNIVEIDITKLLDDK